MDLGIFDFSGDFVNVCPSFQAIAESILKVAAPTISICLLSAKSVSISVYSIRAFSSLARFKFLLVDGFFMSLTPCPSRGLCSPRFTSLRLPLADDLALVVPQPRAPHPPSNRGLTTRFEPSLVFA